MDWIMVWHASRFDSFVPRWLNQSCANLVSPSSIYYWLASSVCKSDTCGSRLKVPFFCNASHFLQNNYVTFHKSADNFEISYKTRSILVWSAVPLKHENYGFFLGSCLLSQTAKGGLYFVFQEKCIKYQLLETYRHAFLCLCLWPTL